MMTVLKRFECTIGLVTIRALLLSPSPGRKLPICYFADVASLGPGEGVSYVTARFRLAQMVQLRPHRITWRRLMTTRHLVRLVTPNCEQYRLKKHLPGHLVAIRLPTPVPDVVLAVFADIINPEPAQAHLPDPMCRDAALQQ